jgi:hypothetical protein
LSVVQLGLRWLRYVINHGLPLQVKVTSYLYPPDRQNCRPVSFGGEGPGAFRGRLR